MIDKIKQCLVRNGKTIVIMRGVPGSGKSTAARALHQAVNGQNLCGEALSDAWFPNAVICSTDDVNESLNGGKYIFQPGFLGLYHGINQSQAYKCMKYGIELVIIDNTNIKRKDFKSYIADAQLWGYTIVEYKVGQTDFSDDMDVTPVMYHARNTHGVPLEVILRMGSQYQEGISYEVK